ncbi:hypothetical protein [Ramlibacter alkalitolerans]|uniref:Uncharacterized protein n=1 Tax=Ramlibacter alkalitolerans TaxID=2039631 RepID=A0ABS1JVT2_9BURK|nr:hypothetical protein [Ramlibacter alkalitolerans]MBL0428324.1 hypothetical protein [Ramlibacter alkalitolerans]
MPAPAVHVRFVGLLSSVRAEALARACIRGLDATYGDVACWDVCLQPPLAPWCSSGYAVRAQARMNDGSMISIRAQGSGLEDTVRDAFDGIEGLLLQEAGAHAAAHPAWRPTATDDARSLAA